MAWLLRSGETALILIMAFCKKHEQDHKLENIRKTAIHTPSAQLVSVCHCENLCVFSLVADLVLIAV